MVTGCFAPRFTRSDVLRFSHILVRLRTRTFYTATFVHRYLLRGLRWFAVLTVDTLRVYHYACGYLCLHVLLRFVATRILVHTVADLPYGLRLHIWLVVTLYLVGLHVRYAVTFCYGLRFAVTVHRSPTPVVVDLPHYGYRTCRATPFTRSVPRVRWLPLRLHYTHLHLVLPHIHTLYYARGCYGPLRLFCHG